MACIFKRPGRPHYLVSYFDHDGRRRVKSTRSSDHKVAERIAAKLEGDAALRREGVVDDGHIRRAEQDRRPLREHLEDYYQDCEHVGHSAKHVVETRRLLDRLAAQTGASRLSDLTVDRVQGHLRSLRDADQSARSVNIVRSTAVAFLGWCLKSGRVESNHLKLLPRLDEQRDCRKVRRALTEAELSRLLDVAELHGRRAWYLTAALAGLRRSELGKLTWGDLDFTAGTLTVRDGKARRVDSLPLHPQLAEELSRRRPDAVLPTARVFPTMVTDVTRRKDFKRAKIDAKDDRGRVADLHALRTTLGTALARHGIAPQVAQRLMRHSKYDLTLRHYTALTLVDTTEALGRLPAIGSEAAAAEVAQATGTDGADRQQFRQQSGHGEPEGAAPRCDGRSDDRSPRPRANPAPSRNLRAPLRSRAPGCNGEGEGTRTLDFQRDRLEGDDGSRETAQTSDGVVSSDNTPDNSQPENRADATAAPDPELAAVVEAWSGLPAAVRAGIVAIVRAARANA